MDVVSFENQLKLKKWATSVVTKNFATLHDIFEETQESIAASSKGGASSVVYYIGSSIAWLGSGASYLVTAGDDGSSPKEVEEADEKERQIIE